MSPSLLYINGRFLTQRVTGVQRYARETLLALDRRIADGLEPPDLRCVVLAPEGTQAPPLRAIEFRRVGPGRGNGWEQVTLPRAARGGLLFSFSASGPIALRRQVLTIHDAAVHAVPQAFHWRFRAWYRLMLGQLAPRVPLVLTVSAFSREELVQHFGCDRRRVRVTTEGWQHVLRPSADRGVLERHGLGARPFVLAVSSPTPNKNFGLVERALRQLEAPAFDVVVAGALDGRVFDRSGSTGLGCVRPIGFVSDGELRALYEHAALFVYPSLYEGFGLPPLEAMALGCPVIASNTGALPEVCGDAVRYISPHDAAGLAHELSRLMADANERERLSQAGRRWAQRYSWEESARLNLVHVREFLASERGPAPLDTCAAPRRSMPPG